MKMNNVNTNKIDAAKPLLRVILAAAAVLILCGTLCGAAGADGIPQQVTTAEELELYANQGMDVILTADITLSSTLIWKMGVLDLNGHVLSISSGGPVLKVSGGATLKDSTPSAEHTFTYQENAAWTLDASPDETAVDLTDFRLTAAQAAEPGTYHVKVCGGIITGGRNSGNGGGMYVESNRGTFTMEGGNIIGNSAKGKGGGIYVHKESAFIMTGGSIIGNYAANDGGGVYFANIRTGEAYVNGITGRCSITGNSAGKEGGGVYVDSWCHCRFSYTQGSELIGPIISENSAYINGGGIFIRSEGTVGAGITTISGNQAREFGGGVYVQGNGFIQGDGFTQIILNTAGQSGGGVYLMPNAQALISAATISGNSPDNIGPQTSYTVTYNGNGNTGGTAPTDSTQYTSGTTVTVLGNTGSLAKTGHTFAGWNTAADGKGIHYEAGQTFTITKSVTFYAEWAKDIVTFTAGEGEGDDRTQKITPGLLTTLNPESSMGFTAPRDEQGNEKKFIGWLVQGSNPEVYYTDQQAVQLTGGVTLSAQWAAVTPISSISGSYGIESPGYYQLTSDVSGLITVNSGVLAVLDLNGKTLNADNGGSAVTNNGVLTLVDSGTGGKITGGSGTTVGTTICGGGVYNSGTFTMNSGVISGNEAGALYSNAEGGGVWTGEGTFTLNGGEISGNIAVSGQQDYARGGGVYNKGTFTMNGGKISDNTAEGKYASGSGVHLNGGTFTMTGGEISGNTAMPTDIFSSDFGNGVHNNGTFKVSGSPVIKGNTAATGTSSISSNVYLDSAYRLTLAGPFTGDIRISEVGGTSIGAGNPFGCVAEGVTVTAADAAHFRNDDGSLCGTVDGSTLKWTETPKLPLIKYNNKTFYAASGQTDSIVGGEGSPFTAGNASYEGTTLTLKEDVSLTAGTLEIVSPKSDTPFTIDLGGKNLIGNGSASVITVAQNAELTVTGTTGKITKGGGTTVGTTLCGSGVYNEGTFTLNGGTISDNCTGMELGDKAGCGGGVYNSGTFTMNGGSITGNNAQDSGGGVYNKGMFIMNGGTISGNTACPQDLIFDIKCDGGGVYNSGTFTMNNGTISGNTAGARGDSNGGSGGGVYVNSGSTFTMNNGTISGNKVSNSNTDCGGGVYVGGTFIMNNGTISGNSVKDGRTTRGGGVYVAGTFTLNGGEITGNQAESNDTVCGGGGVYVTQGTFNISGNPIISGNTGGRSNNVYLGSAEMLTLTGSFTGDIRISEVGGKQIAAGQPFGLVAEGVTEGFDKFKNDTGTLSGKLDPANLTLIWGAAPPETPVLTAFTSDGGIKTAKVTEPTSILQKVTTKESSNVSWLVFKPHETLGDLPVTIDGREVAIVDDSFKMILGNAEELTEPQREISASGSSPAAADSALAVSPGRQPYPAPSDIVPAAGVQVTLSGKLKANLIDGQENKLRLAQKTDADKWVLLPVSNGKKTEDGEYYTFDAAFTSTENGGYMFVIAEGTDPTPTPTKSSSKSQGTSIWLTAEPTPTETPAPTPTVTPAPEVPSVKPVEQKPAAQTGASSAPVMGVIAALGCAAVVFGLRRK